MRAAHIELMRAAFGACDNISLGMGMGTGMGTRTNDWAAKHTKNRNTNTSAVLLTCASWARTRCMKYAKFQTICLAIIYFLYDLSQSVLFERRPCSNMCLSIQLPLRCHHHHHCLDAIAAAAADIFVGLDILNVLDVVFFVFASQSQSQVCLSDANTISLRNFA